MNKIIISFLRIFPFLLILQKSWTFVIIVIGSLILMAQARWWNRIKNEEGRRESHEFEPIFI